MKSRSIPLIPRRVGALALSLAALLLVALAPPVAAHEIVLLPERSDDLLPVVVPGDHLSFAEPIDFGSELVGVGTTLPVSITNAGSLDVDIVVEAPSGVVVNPAQFSLAAGAQTAIQATYTRPVEEVLDGEIDLSVSHVGVSGPFHELIQVLGEAVPPPELTVSIPAWGLDDVEVIDLGLIANRTYEFGDYPSVEVVVTNTGGATATGIDLHFLETPIVVVEPFGRCGLGQVVKICVEGPGGQSVLDLGDLAPGESTTTTWTYVPQQPGTIARSLRFETDDPNVEQEIGVVGEVIAFTLPEGIDFLKSAAQAEGHFGTVDDPLGADPLAQLRPKSFDARTVFSVGEIDTVDLRAGNLTLMIPIGGEIQARGPLSYALSAVYNSDLWHRKSLDTIEPDQGPGRPMPLSGEWPDALYNLRGGWAMHLGRLLPPFPFDGTDATTLCQSSDPLGFERKVDTGERFVYVDPTGTQHEFWAKLHGEEPTSAQNGWVPPEDRQISYSRDGSYLRMVKEGSTVRWIEEPGGLRRKFQTGIGHASMPDQWVLTRIEDRHGNRVDISYTIRDGQVAWVLSDNSGYRETVVKFQDWSGRKSDQPMIVDKVELPGFDGGATRVYDFSYTNLTINRPARSNFHSVAQAYCQAQGHSLDISLRLPRLDSITLPDGKQWAFTYTTGGGTDLRMTWVDMPTAGRIEYQYADLVWDAPPTCTAAPSGGHPGIDRRIVHDVGGGVLEDTRYLRQIRKTSDIPEDYCAVQDAPAAEKPYAEQVVGVWKDVSPIASAQTTWENPASSTLQLHYFNIWQYGDECNEGMTGCVFRDGAWRLDSGRSLFERNAMTSHSNVDAGGRYLSSESYRCSTGLGFNPGFDILGGDFAGDRIENLADVFSRCQRQEQNWAQYEISLGGYCPSRPSPLCNRDSRKIVERTVFKNDDDRWHQTTQSDFDGLGHYRKQLVTASWNGDGQNTPPSRTTYQRWNPSVGTLVLGPDHRVTTNITPPSTWVLQTWDRQFVREKPHIDPQWSVITRGGEACFDGATGHLKATSDWACDGPGYLCSAASETGGLAAVRSNRDVVTRHEINASGEVLRNRTFGADTFSPTTGNDWCTQAFGWPAAQQDHGVEYTYQFGLVATEKVHGASTTMSNRTIDQATGWIERQILDSGETIDFEYDSLGRIESVISDRTASYHFAYETIAGGRRQLRARTFPSGTPGGGGPVIRTYLARYDGLGRLWQEDLPTASGGSVTRTVTYDRAGRVNKVTSLDAPSRATTYLYDYKGRPILENLADGSNIEYIHYGDRKSRRFTCVDTNDPSGLGSTGPCRNTSLQGVETETLKDFFGRALRVKQSYQNSDGFQTSFLYESSGQPIYAARKDLESNLTQLRTWSFDGLGNMLLERIPERADTAYSNFDTRGNARRSQGGGRTTDFAFDVLSRPTSVKLGSFEIKSFTYFTSGTGNGMLKQAIRRHDHDAVHTASGEPGQFYVTSDFGYDTAGRQDYRRTLVEYDEDGAAPPTRMAEFEQGWSYDVLGNVDTVVYPTCLTAATCMDDTLTVTNQISQGYYLTGVDASGTSTLDATLTYHPSGVVHQVIHSGGGGTDVYGVADGMSRIASIELASGTASALNLGAVTYDGAGNIRSIGGETFSYDRHSRLVSANVRGPSGMVTKSYGFDGFDNRTTPYAADPATNHLTVGTYDAFGNLVQSGTTSITVDGLDKIIAVTFPQPPDGQGQAQPDAHQIALYDHDDLRIVRWDKNVDPLPVWTLRDGLRVIREFDGSGPGVSTRADFVYAGTRLISSRRYTGLSYPVGNERHYHQDQVGTSRLITGYDGHEVFTEPFGVPLDDAAGNPSLSGERTVGFQGHERDGATTYMRGRQYFPAAGRFVQVDPARDTSSWSLYGFEANNPIRYIDPNGTETLDPESEAHAGQIIEAFGRAVTPFHPPGGAVFQLLGKLINFNSTVRVAHQNEIARLTAGSFPEVLGKLDAEISAAESSLRQTQTELRYLYLEANLDRDGNPTDRSEIRRSALVERAKAQGFQPSKNDHEWAARTVRAEIDQFDTSHRLLRLRELRKGLVGTYHLTKEKK